MELGSSADPINQLKMPMGAVSYGANIHESSTSKKIINSTTNTTSNILISNTNTAVNHSINNINNTMGTLSQVTETAINGSIRSSGGNDQHNTNINSNSTSNQPTAPASVSVPMLSINPPATAISSKKPISGTNSSSLVKYKECMKNHAANMGGYAVDGCGEFMPSGEEGSIEALKCAACGCHRNFHRRETNGGTPGGMSILALPSTVGPNPTSCNSGGSPISGSGGGGPNDNSTDSNMQEAAYPGNYGHHHHHHPHPAYAGMNGAAAMASFLHHQYAGLQHHHHHLMAAAATAHGHAGGPAPLAKLHGGHPLQPGHHHHPHHHHHSSTVMSAKRFRTKFTMEQREKMFEFSEKLGWRIQKHDEAAVQQFCAETGVKRHVLKVWMHNNKNTFGKKLLRLSETLNPLPEQSS